MGNSGKVHQERANSKEHLIAPWPDSTVQTSKDWSSVGMIYNKAEYWPLEKADMLD